MAHIKKNIQFPESSRDYDQAAAQEINNYLLKLSDVINGGLRIADNCDVEIVVVADTGTADTEFTVTHTLKRVPAGYIIVSIDKAGVVYKTGTAWTTAAIYLKCSAANAVVSVLVF